MERNYSSSFEAKLVSHRFAEGGIGISAGLIDAMLERDRTEQEQQGARTVLYNKPEGRQDG